MKLINGCVDIIERVRPIYNWEKKKRTILKNNYDIIECLIMDEDVYYWPCAISTHSTSSSYMCNRLDNSSIKFLMKVEDYENFMNERIFIKVNLIIPGI